MLSLAGRTMLIQASLAAIPSYVMQCTHLLVRILDGIDRVNRNFLWCSTESTNKVHWVGWQKLTRSKEEGGLGLQSSRGRNVALLTKLNWRFHTEKETLWAQVLWRKYYTRNANNLLCSSTWATMKRGMETFNKGSRWLVGKDSNLNVWDSSWMSKGPLR